MCGRSSWLEEYRWIFLVWSRWRLCGHNSMTLLLVPIGTGLEMFGCMVNHMMLMWWHLDSHGKMTIEDTFLLCLVPDSSYSPVTQIVVIA